MRRVRAVGAASFSPALALVLATVTTLGWAATAQAHPTATTAIVVHADGGTVTGRMFVPYHRLEVVLAPALPAAAAGGLDGQRGAITAYVTDRLHLRDPQGAPWTVHVDPLSVTTLDRVEHLMVPFRAEAPAARTAPAFDLSSDVLLDRIVTHELLVFGHPDPASLDGTNGLTGTTYLGTIDSTTASLRIEGAAPRWTTAFADAAQVGFTHLSEGGDHLLFVLLLALAVPASMRAGGGGPAVRDLARRSLAFTFGHSASLALTATGLVAMASRTVEILIAVTLAITALGLLLGRQATDRDTTVVGVFGLIHGFGFAAAITALGLRGWTLAAAVAGFNLGLEVAQLAGLALLAPSLLLLERLGRAEWVVRIGAAAVLTIAVAWALERALGVPLPLDSIETAVIAVPVPLAVVLTCGAVGGLAHRGRTARSRAEASA